MKFAFRPKNGSGLLGAEYTEVHLLFNMRHAIRGRLFGFYHLSQTLLTFLVLYEVYYLFSIFP